MITIRHRAPGQSWSERQFPTDAEAGAFVQSLSAGTEASYGGHPQALPSRVMPITVRLERDDERPFWPGDLLRIEAVDSAAGRLELVRLVPATETAPATEDELLTVKQAANMLKVVPHTIYRMCDAGTLVSVRFGKPSPMNPDGRSLRIRRSSVAAVLAQRGR